MSACLQWTSTAALSSGTRSWSSPWECGAPMPSGPPSRKFSLAPLARKCEERLGRLILVDDITQRMQLEEQLVQTEKLTSLGLLAAGVAHEVNTPLAVISNYIQMLAKQLPSNDPRQKLTDKIVKQTFRASEIVNNLLNFSRTGGAAFKEVNLNQVIDETLTLAAHPFRAGNVQVIKNLDA